ncbi:MAG: hypothetical protein KA801_02640 [Syntrophorhabdaceae bacterium]|nr:hypothetical protein [Syntrophorhabdaceae bacterium]
MKVVAVSNTIYPDSYATSSGHRDKRLDELSYCTSQLDEQIARIGRIIRSSEPVPAALFKDSPFLTADEKKNVLHDWNRFIKNGYAWSCFTDKIYKHLSLHCGFIAHFNRIGFYQTYWREDVPALARERNMAVRPVPEIFFNWVPFLAQYTIWLDYDDVNIAMIYSLRSSLIALRSELKNEVIRLFHTEINYRSGLARDRKDHIGQLIDDLRSQIKALEMEREQMNPEGYVAKRASYYRELFPSMDDESFSTKGLAGNLF